jgi:translation elongation factor Ts
MLPGGCPHPKEIPMPAITASMVAELRAKTDAPMMECKKALTEADGDMGRAEEILRVKLGNKASKASARIAAEGVVAASVSGTTGSLLEVNCETDFVTKNDSFLAFAKACAALVAERNPADLAALARCRCRRKASARRWKTCARASWARSARTCRCAASSAMPVAANWPATCTARASA